MNQVDRHPRDAAPTLQDLAREGRDWLFGAAAPQWLGAKKGDVFLFPERFSIHGEADACPHRLFVQARHIFSYCEMGRLGWDGPWREMAECSADFLLRAGRRADGFFIHRFDSEGAVFDARADLYDQAFMLLALAHIGRAAQRPDFFVAAEALDDALDADWRLGHGGYFEGEIAQCPPFRQNPHMHLFEAFIALHAATGAPRWKVKADHIATLCERSFIDPASGALLEYFDETLQPLPGDDGRIVEPGHCFEWAWLMEQLAQAGHPDAIGISDRFAHFARAYGVDAGGGVAINEVMTDGRVRNGAARLWPQTERLKAALARYRRTGDPRESAEAAAAFAGLLQYFDTPKRGVWRDKLRADGSWIEEPAPGSSLY
ncbi:MAG TPA: AGE family epimerase/isomerase, partial [Rhodoblastus sp.]|nr:AGE family epimerase/isomerase [Rhodoblastus sp.]